jgi:hypothetical protein
MLDLYDMYDEVNEILEDLCKRAESDLPIYVGSGEDFCADTFWSFKQP